MTAAKGCAPFTYLLPANFAGDREAQVLPDNAGSLFLQVYLPVISKVKGGSITRYAVIVYKHGCNTCYLCCRIFLLCAFLILFFFQL